jgi:alpha-D-ribose 1-methylphosphonate 5-triphosphate synthase subunit PhnL
MHVEDAAGIPIPRIAELDIDTGECVVLLCYDNTNSGIGTVRVDVKLNYFKLVSGTWYLEYKAKDIAQ